MDIFLSVCVCVCILMNVYTHAHTYVFVYIYIYIFIYVNIYIYKYICIYLNGHTKLFTCKYGLHIHMFACINDDFPTLRSNYFGLVSIQGIKKLHTTNTFFAFPRASVFVSGSRMLARLARRFSRLGTWSPTMWLWSCLASTRIWMSNRSWSWVGSCMRSAGEVSKTGVYLTPQTHSRWSSRWQRNFNLQRSDGGTGCSKYCPKARLSSSLRFTCHVLGGRIRGGSKFS